MALNSATYCVECSIRLSLIQSDAAMNEVAD